MIANKLLTTQMVLKTVCGALVVFVLLVAAGYSARVLPVNLGVYPKKTGVYAVFLSNNQVYFGSIAHEDDKRVVLTSIYYIQPQDPAVPSAANAAGVSLLKLGNEVHGPEDQMEINREHVVFIEKLKTDGKVAKAIAAYKEK